METPSRFKTIAGWTVRILLALLFAAASSAKLTGNPAVVEMFSDWGFPDGFYRIVGALELGGAVGLLIPRVAGLAAVGLFGIMIGAAATHLTNGEGLQVLRPAIFMALLAVVIWIRRPWPFASRG